jgi:hypothetical protein
MGQLVRVFLSRVIAAPPALMDTIADVGAGMRK